MSLKSRTGVTIFVTVIVLVTLLSCTLVSGHPHHEISNRRQRSHNSHSSHSHHHHYKSSRPVTTTATADVEPKQMEDEVENNDDTILPVSASGAGTRRVKTPLKSKYHHNRNRNAHKNKHVVVENLDDNYEDDDYDDDDDVEEEGRHAYLMKSDHSTENENSSSHNEAVEKPVVDDEDTALRQAFEKHMRPTNENSNLANMHDVYAYHLPSDLWFIVRYAKTAEGQVEKYMNIVDSFTNYLDKLEPGVKNVSVNVKGVETVFRLTSRPRH